MRHSHFSVQRFLLNATRARPSATARQQQRAQERDQERIQTHRKRAERGIAGGDAEIRDRRQPREPRERRTDDAGKHDGRLRQHRHRPAQNDSKIAIPAHEALGPREVIGPTIHAPVRRAHTNYVPDQATCHHPAPDHERCPRPGRACTPAPVATMLEGTGRKMSSARSAKMPAAATDRDTPLRVICSASALNWASKRKKGSRTRPISNPQSNAHRM